ncbi:MAG TPA: magnesium/cobalt transporter CorA [Haliangium sp.]|nr:magnesium/cobalt transporter CorA [Haliangium sp.]
MYRVLDVGPEQAPLVGAGPERVARPEDGVIRWIDLSAQGDGELQLLAERFGFHPLTIEDCAHFDQRAKLEEYSDYLFIVMHGFDCPDGDARKLEPLELHAFLGQGYLVTVHEKPIPALEAAWRRITSDPATARRGADFIYYLVLDAIVDTNFAHLDLLSDALESIEEAVLERADRDDLAHIFALKRTLVTMRKTLSPQRDVLAILAKRGSVYISDRTSIYYRDVYDHLVRIYESIDASRDLLGNALDVYLSMVGQRTNDIMKSLTVLSAIFLPLTFVTGFFGQNFEHLPFSSDPLMWTMILTCFALPGGMVWWFKSRQWL